MSLLQYLKAAGGEASLLSRLGVWRQKVSARVDAHEAAYIEVVRLNATQLIANLAIPTDVVFNSTASQRGLASISYDSATGEFTLQPGAYELDARLAFGGFDTEASDIAEFHWKDSSGFDLGQGAAGTSIPAASTRNLAAQPSVKAYLDILATTIVKVVVVGGQGGASVDVGSHATVLKVG